MNGNDKPLGMFAVCPICGQSLSTPAKLARRVSDTSVVVVVDTTRVKEHLQVHTAPLREAARVLDELGLQ